MDNPTYPVPVTAMLYFLSRIGADTAVAVSSSNKSVTSKSRTSPSFVTAQYMEYNPHSLHDQS